MKIIPKKSLGQNFLIDHNILNIIINSVEINNKNNILEIGPGKGSLTEKILLKNPKKIIVVEKDKNLTKILKVKFGKQLRIINDDILKLNEQFFDSKNLVIFGNLPYNISTKILIRLIKLSYKYEFNKLILMFQKEVADRIIANKDTKEFGRISIISQLKFNIKKLLDINPKCFYPVPKVTSSVLVFSNKNNFFKLKNLKNLEHVTNIFFNLRRKMIKKPLKILFKDANYISDKLNLKLTDRPQKLSPQMYYKICEEYEKHLK
ncbi:MAG: ribosomal RNA small subunit methyltransferase A [Rickettsiales bacterium TMED289]|mgnify:CR=1 FL=1|nr:MAG: ribosomal RNA small subunit methyltransferase A [Rickettsiales bacterium TMED289]|tara:strand:- start:590 stop:1378 length:789 start_codon:yes stop_codon:yes gene_type:complete